MSKTKVWMFWWNTCPTHKVMPREYLEDGMRNKRCYRCQQDIPMVSKLCRFEVESVENGGTLSDRAKSPDRSVEDLTRSPSSSHSSYGMSRAARALTVR